jgi:ATP-dependent exoDNAse (exonuclease V) beta subunit
MFTVYSASAGSGKTYNLVLDYIATCLKYHVSAFLRDRHNYVCHSCTDFKHILAITFTNNAGSEMKERVVRQLNHLAFAQSVSDLKPNDFDNLCRKVFGEQHTLSREECFTFVNKTAKTLLYNILYDYAQFSITTIDSFIQRVIRSSALYLNLSMNYAVQIHLTDFFRMAIEQYICDLTNNNKQLSVVVKELEQELEDKGNANINRFLTQGLSTLYYDAEKSHHYVKNIPEMEELEKVVEQWKKNCLRIQEQCKTDIKDLVKQALAVFEEAEKEEIRPNGTYNWDKHIARIAEDPFNLEKGFSESKCLQEMDANKVFSVPQKGSKAEKERKKSLKADYGEQVKKLFSQIQQIVMDYSKEFLTNYVLAKNANRLLVLTALQQHIETIKEQTDSFFLSESNPLLNDAIADSNGDPLFEKLSFYRHFFIDEFQDTSLMQWQDLKPLIINALGEKGDVILFGDVKQSIYRFRNGDVELFYQLSDYNRFLNTPFEKDIFSLLKGPADYQRIPLKTNFRSQSSVIEFNNRFFQFYATTLNKTDYYLDVEQSINPSKMGGLVQIFGYNKQDYKDIRQVWPECPEEFYQDIYLKLKQEEAELLYAVKDAKQRGYAYGDMAVLLSGRAKCNVFAQRLLQADVPVITTESLQLCDNSSINLLVSTLRYLVNPKDMLAQTTILHYFCIRHHQNFDTALLQNKEKDFLDVLDELFPQLDYKHHLGIWEKNPFSISMKEMIRFYQFDDSENPFIADFLDLVHEFEKSQVASVPAFLIWWDDLNRYSETIPRLSLSGSSDAVRLMTIHASKGMEFPVVITHCSSSNSREAYYWVTEAQTQKSCYVKHEKNMKFSDFQEDYEAEEDKKNLDSLNLWYVDFTRACDVLYLLTDFSESKTNEKTDIKKALQQFIENPDNQIVDNQNHIYYYGDFDWKKPHHVFKEESQLSDFHVSYSSLTFCDNDSVNVNVSETNTESQDTGTYIHNFLQKLTLFPTTEEERNAVTSGLPDDIRTRLHQLFERTEQDSRLRSYFYLSEGDQVLNEVTILTKNGEERRPDRVVIKPDHVMIIDYKTGREYKDKYEKQLEEYRNCLMGMGYKDVRTEILYVD